MLKRTTWYDTIGGKEVHYEFEPVSQPKIQALPDGKLLVSYLTYDMDHPDPVSVEGGDGRIVKGYGRSDWSIIRRALGLDLEASEATPDLTLDVVVDGARVFLIEHIGKSFKLKALSVQLALETGCKPYEAIIDLWENGHRFSAYGDSLSDDDLEVLHELPDYTQRLEIEWWKAYERGDVGEPLAVPLKYVESNHGPGTATISVCDVLSCNAVWLPDELALSNMDFSTCKSYADKFEVVEAYVKPILKAHQMWLNGECYGAHVQVHDRDGSLLDVDSVWGVVGHHEAEEYLQSELVNPMLKRIAK